MHLLLLDVNFQIRFFHEPYISFVSFVAVPTRSYKDSGNAGTEVRASLLHSLQNVFQELPLSFFPKCWGGRRSVLALGRKRTFACQLTLEKVICGVQGAEATNFKDFFMFHFQTFLLAPVTEAFLFSHSKSMNIGHVGFFPMLMLKRSQVWTEREDLEFLGSSNLVNEDSGRLFWNTCSWSFRCESQNYPPSLQLTHPWSAQC